jgi:hypothetical protein
MNMRKKYREEDASIEEENQEIAFTRKVIEAATIAEQQGRPKRDRLTNDERNTIIRWRLESKMRSLETQYWLRISELRAEGLTMEQAREKIYQDLVDKGDVEGARMMHTYQNRIHPPKADNPEAPTSSPPPSSST